MRRWVAVGVVLAALGGATSPAGANLRDQTQDSVSGSLSVAADGSRSSHRAQTFTASADGPLDQVDLRVAFRSAPPAQPLRVQIRTVEAGLPGSTVLAESEIAPAGVPPEDADIDWIPVPFADPAVVAAGTEYAIVLSAQGTDTYVVDVSMSENWYEAGQFATAHGITPTSWTATAEWDLAFRTYVVPSFARPSTVTFTDPGTATFVAPPGAMRVVAIGAGGAPSGLRAGGRGARVTGWTVLGVESSYAAGVAQGAGPAHDGGGPGGGATDLRGPDADGPSARLVVAGGGGGAGDDGAGGDAGTDDTALTGLAGLASGCGGAVPGGGGTLTEGGSAAGGAGLGGLGAGGSGAQAGGGGGAGLFGGGGGVGPTECGAGGGGGSSFTGRLAAPTVAAEPHGTPASLSLSFQDHAAPSIAFDELRTLTNDATPTFAGTGGRVLGDLPEVTVEIFRHPEPDEEGDGTVVQSLTGTADAVTGAFSVTTAPLPDGYYGVRAMQRDLAAFVRTTRAVGFRVDATAPALPAVTAPAASATYLVGEVVAAAYTCADAAGGSGIATCAGPVADGAPIDTDTAGEKTFTVTATDAAGNTTDRTVTYTVVTSLPVTTDPDPAPIVQPGGTTPAPAQPEGTTPPASGVGAPAAGPPRPTARLITGAARVRSGRLTVRIACATGARCAGTLVLRHRPRGARKAIVVGRARFTLAAGGQRRVTVRLSKRAATLLRRARDRRLRTSATLEVTGARPTVRAVVLRR